MSSPRSRPTSLWRKLALGVVVALATLAASLLALERWVERNDAWGVSYFEDVQRYLREAVEPVKLHGPEGRLFQNRPDVDLELRTFRYRTDSLRLRRGAAEPTYDPATFEGLRILCLGDSVTLGWGVDDEDTWVRLLEREGRAPDGSPLACLNTGHLMFDSLQEAELLDAWGPEHRPDVVLLTYVFNDLYPTWDQLTGMTEPGERSVALGGTGGDGVEEAASDLAWRSPDWLRRLFPHLFRLGTYWRQERAFNGPGRMSKPPFNFYPKGWPRSEAALDRILARCEELGARLVLFESNQYGPPLVELHAWCERNDVPYVPIHFRADELARGVQNSRVDPHANRLGNRLIADKALAALRALGILAP